MTTNRILSEISQTKRISRPFHRLPREKRREVLEIAKDRGVSVDVKLIKEVKKK